MELTDREITKLTEDALIIHGLNTIDLTPGVIREDRREGYIEYIRKTLNNETRVSYLKDHIRYEIQIAKR